MTRRIASGNDEKEDDEKEDVRGGAVDDDKCQ